MPFRGHFTTPICSRPEPQSIAGIYTMALYANGTSNTAYKPLPTTGSLVYSHKDIVDCSFVLAVQVFLYLSNHCFALDRIWILDTHAQRKQGTTTRLSRPEFIQTVLSFRKRCLSPKQLNSTTWRAPTGPHVLGRGAAGQCCASTPPSPLPSSPNLDNKATRSASVRPLLPLHPRPSPRSLRQPPVIPR
jgi:hypothetical protein